MSINKKYQDLAKEAFGYAEGSEYFENNKAKTVHDDFGNSLIDIDFSEIRGKNFKRNLSKVNRKLNTKVIASDNRKVIIEGADKDLILPKSGQKVIAPDNRKVIVEGAGIKGFSKPRMASPRIMQSKPVEETQLDGGESYNVKSKNSQKISKVIVPDNKNVIVQGVSDFILSQSPTGDMIKNIGYYKGKKLKELVLTFNNDSGNDFDLELFNPSMPLDFLYSTSLNLNDKIQVAGGEVAYTDVLFNILANSTMIPNAKFVFAGAQVSAQKNESIRVINKSIDGKDKVSPFGLNLQVDTMQVADDIVFFDFLNTINRPYIPDGMDVLKYKILPNMTVTMGFYYDQISLKKVFRKESRNDKGVL